ncbi:MAG: hypothetical protein AB7O56_03135 [Bauldia sp.]
MRKRLRRRVAGVVRPAAVVVAAIAAAGTASAENPWPAPAALTPELILVGHGAEMAQIVPRLPGRVTAVGEPDADGNIYSFEIDITDLALNEIRSWRLTFVSGELFAYVFQIRENDGPRVSVTSIDGPLNGIAVGDGFLIEQTPVRRPVPQLANPGT